MKFGDIYMADLSPVIGSEHGSIRPVLIVQEHIPKNAESVMCAAISTSLSKEDETHISLRNCETDKYSNAYVLLEQIRNIGVQHLKENVCAVSEECQKLIKNNCLETIKI